MSAEGKTRILIVDDEELICWSLKQTLERQGGFLVSCSYTGDDALRSMLKNRYDVIITDLRLPDLNGTELLEKMRGLVKDIPVIVISAYLYDHAMYDISEFDVFKCVNKPFELTDVLASVQDAVAKSALGTADQRTP